MAKVYKNPGPLEFLAVIQRDTEVNNSSAWIEFPYDLKELYGVGNLVPFKATFDGRVKYQGSLAKMGGPQAMVLLRKDVRAELGKEPGDTVRVRIELDDAPRTIPLPSDMKPLLEKSGLLEFWNGLAFSHQREYMRWIDDAKRPETRAARIATSVDLLAQGKKEPR